MCLLRYRVVTFDIANGSSQEQCEAPATVLLVLLATQIEIAKWFLACFVNVRVVPFDFANGSSQRRANVLQLLAVLHPKLFLGCSHMVL